MFVLQFFVSIIIVTNFARAVPFLKNFESTENAKPRSINVDYKLSSNVKPLHYVISLRPNIEVNNFTFTGESSIDIEVKDVASSITLHAKNLTIDEPPELETAVSGSTSVYVNHTIDTETDFLTINFNQTFSGNATLRLKYTGILHDDLYGFYRSSYLNERGEKVWLATTQFEPTHARRAYPCFDEPALKATFKISINHPDKLRAVSNMPLESITSDKDDFRRQWTHFEITPVMSTYLVGFVVSDFDYLSNDDGRFRVWSKPHVVKTGEYAVEQGVKALEALNLYTAIDHYDIMKKMDNFAIPDFAAGAMENWGVVTYRESALLVEENVTTTAARQSVATIIAHEFAHQWFGNLVSPATWNYTWLNEGFANYFQYYITNQINNGSRLMDQFVVENLQKSAFIADDKEDQHPMNGNVITPSEISKFFDAITYSKAGSVIRMISHVLGDESFQTGLQAYLKKMTKKAATSNDLFEELAKASPKAPVDLVKAFDSWASQPGYPVIQVNRNYTTRTAEITQKRFLTMKTKEPKETWFVPINYATRTKPNFTDTKPSEWLSNGAVKSITITELKPDDWVIFNKQQTGYYRVNYDITNWMQIVKHLKSEKYNDIHVLNRAQLLDDSFHLAQAGELSNHLVFLNMTLYLRQESDYAPWAAGFRALSTLNRALSNTAHHSLFKLYSLRLMEKLEQTLGYDGNTQDDDVTIFTRINTIALACYMGSENCSASAHEKLVNHVFGSTKISTDLQSVVLCAGIRAANATVWNETLGYYRKSKLDYERAALLAALGCTTRPEELRSLLAESLKPGSLICVNDAIKAVVIGGNSGPDVAFDFINANLSAIVAINNKTEFIVEHLNSIASRMTTQVHVDKLNKFIAENPNFATALKDKALVSAKQNVEWVKTHQPTIASFLMSQNLIAPTTTGSNDSGIMVPGVRLIILALAASILSRIL